MKLEIGGQSKKEGWSNLNINPTDNPAILADAFNKLPLTDNSIEEIFASHVIEHAGWCYISDILKDWVRVLVPQGKLHIICPDFKDHVKSYLENPWTLYENDMLAVGIYGHQHMGIPMYHRTGLDKEHLEKYLLDAGLDQLIWDTSNHRELNVYGFKK